MTDLASSARPEIMATSRVSAEPYVDTGFLDMNPDAPATATEPVIDAPEHYDPAVLTAHLRTVQPRDPEDPLKLTIDALAVSLPKADKVTEQGVVIIRDAEFLVSYLGERESDYAPAGSEALNVPEMTNAKELDSKELRDGLEAALREVTIVDPQIRRTANMILVGLKRDKPSEQQLKDASYMLGCILSSTPTPAA